MEYRCPKCKQMLSRIEQTYRCENGHTYDIAKSGYTNLFLSNRKMSGDNKEMVQARTRFLSHGYYEPLLQRICALVKENKPDVLIDAGCGEGYYTNACKTQLPNCEIFGFDVSKYALMQAVKAKNKVQYAVASVKDMPLVDGCGDMLISVFAPIYIEEVRRILKSNGIFLKVEPGPKHLYELKTILYDEVYDNEAEAVSYEGMALIHEELLDADCDIQSQEDIQALFQMTPYYYRTSKEAGMRLMELEHLSTRIQFHIELYQKQS